MKNKILKKVIGLYGYKLVEKNFFKNQRISNNNSTLNIKNILKNYLRKNKIESLIQIGANDGDRFDELSYFIKKYKIKSILVEPIKKYFLELKNNYKNFDFVQFENSAISVNNEISHLFTVNEKFLKKYDDHVQGLSSFAKKHLINHGINAHHIEEKKINSISIKNLIQKYKIEKLDLIYIDAEGYDGKIILDFILNIKIHPIIIFEYIHVENKLLEKVLNTLDKNNFKYFPIKENIICYPSNKELAI